MTNTRLLEIGIQKRNGLLPKISWNELVILHCPTKFKDGEGYRGWVKREVKKIGQLEHKEVKNILNSEVEQLKQKSSTEIHPNGNQSSERFIEMTEVQSKDISYILKAHGYDTDIWELVSAKSNIWNAYSTQDGKILMYSSKISVKPRVSTVDPEFIKKMFADMSKDYKCPVHKPTRYSIDGKMLEINISDLHLSKIATVETSNDTYNYEIAKERFFHVINDVLTRTAHYKFEKILFVYSQDFFHYDGISQSTTGGTKMESDLRWTELFKIGVQMLVDAIDLLSQVAPVLTHYVESNHDKQVSYYAVEYLYAWFRNNQNVTVDNNARSRKYVEFGQNLIGLAHGHNEKKRLAYLMPLEAKEAWARTSYREFHLGHIHSEKQVTEENGIIIRHVSSITGTDVWHFDQAFVGAIKKSQCFVYDKELGLTDILHTTFKGN